MSTSDQPVDMTKCCLSSWDGDDANCRHCNALLLGRRRAWCSNSCFAWFLKNHKYSRARAAARLRARAACDCPDSEFRYRTSSGSWRRRPKHSVCRVCGKCEPRLVADGKGRLECNHIQPVLGQRRGWSCLNHEDNLEMLCHEDHLEVTRGQRTLWPQTPKARRKAHVKTAKASNEADDRPLKRAARRRIA